LAGFEAALRLVDNVNAALAPDDAIIAMTAAQRFQRIANFHWCYPDDRAGAEDVGNCGGT
jgi:hypothetical protein